MQQSLKEFLIDQQADMDTIKEAAQYYLAERTDYRSSEEMYQQLVEVVGDANAVDSTLRALENDPLLEENAALALLSFAWEEPREVERIKRAVETAKTKLPVIEIAILAIAGMYGMYLIATASKKSKSTVTMKKPDGSFEEKTTTEWYGPTGPLHSIVALFQHSEGKFDKEEKKDKS